MTFHRSWHRACTGTLLALALAGPGHAIIGNPVAAPRYVALGICYNGDFPEPGQVLCPDTSWGLQRAADLVGPTPRMGSVHFEQAQAQSAFRVTEVAGLPPRTGNAAVALGAQPGIHRAETGYLGPTAGSIWGQYNVQAVSEMRREGWFRTHLSLGDGNTVIGPAEATAQFSARYTLGNVGAVPIPGDFSANIEPSEVVLGGYGIHGWSAGAVAASFSYRVQVQDTTAQGATQTVGDWWWQATVQSRDNASVGYDPLTGRWRGNMVQLPWRGQLASMPDWIDASFQLLADTASAGAPAVLASASDEGGYAQAVRHFNVQPFGLTLQLPLLAPGDTRSFVLQFDSRVAGDARDYDVLATFVDPAQIGGEGSAFGLNGMEIGLFAPPVPEPGTLLLWMGGLAALALAARRRVAARAAPGPA
jgi:PEP-CTERM motif